MIWQTYMWDLHLISYMWDVIQSTWNDIQKSKIWLEVLGVANLQCKYMLDGVNAIKCGISPRFEISLRSR